MVEDPHALTQKLQRGDEDAFRALVRQNHASLVSLAHTIVNDPDIAEELAQETWLQVIGGLRSFEGRSSLRTWIFGICVNLSKKRIRRDARLELWEALSSPGDDPVLAQSFAENGAWAKPPSTWCIDPEQQAQQNQLLVWVQAGIEELPRNQRMVLQLCDVEGFSGTEVAEMLDLTPSNQRVLLHRARNSVRIFVESHMESS